MTPPRPSVCPFEGCSGQVYLHGSYQRFVVLPDGMRVGFGVHRMRCDRCGRTISYLPDFCVPYKHFACDVIAAVLSAVLLVGVSRRAAAEWDSAWNAASFSRFCVGDWVRQFGRNSHNLWHFGLERLGLVSEEGRGSLRAADIARGAVCAQWPVPSVRAVPGPVAAGLLHVGIHPCQRTDVPR
jgi:hypothetical protein